MAWSAAAVSPLKLTALPSTSLSLSPSSLLQEPSFISRRYDNYNLSITSNKFLHNPSLLENCSSNKIYIKPNVYSRHLTVKSQLRFPLVSPDDHWGLWTALLATGAFGIWLERTKIGSMVCAALVSTLVRLAANLWQVIRSTGPLFLAFFLGSVATVIGTLVAFLLVPMRLFGQDNWKIAASLMGSYIGRTINYVAISEALAVSASVLAAGVVADNVICAIYFIVLFALSSKIPSEAPTSTSGDARFMKFDSESDLSAITAIVVVLATLLPKYVYSLAPTGDVIAIVLMQVFFAVVGASGSIWNVINTAPSIFMFALVQVTVHLIVILGLGRLFCIDQKLLLIASNANVGGPTTACGMATAKGWNSLVVPGILAGIFGISIATFLGIAFELVVLKHFVIWLT